jgi:lysophospholipase L1-like esterase
MEIIPQYNNTNPTYHASINTMKQATVTQLAGWGFNVVWAPILNSPYAGAFDAVNYINNSAVTDPDGLSCGGATSDNVHPNNCGHKEMFNALMSDFAR